MATPIKRTPASVFVRELAAQVIREDAAKLSNWEHDDVYRDNSHAKAFRRTADTMLNNLRWDHLTVLANRYGLSMPTMP